MPRNNQPDPNPNPPVHANSAALLARLEPMLEKLPKVDNITMDLGAAGVQANMMHKLVTQAPVSELMAHLPPQVFDAGQVALLADLAQTCTLVKNENLIQENAADERMIPVALADAGTNLRKRLLKLVAYWLDEDPVAAAEIASIREGAGYRDLSSDLFRLGTLIDKHQAKLARDQNLYQANDAAEARRLSAAITDALAAPDPFGDDLEARLLTLLRATYDDVRAAAIFASRRVLPAENFPSLHGINQGGRRKKKNPPPQ